MDINGEYRSFCPAHGPPALAAAAVAAAAGNGQQLLTHQHQLHQQQQQQQQQQKLVLLTGKLVTVQRYECVEPVAELFGIIPIENWNWFNWKHWYANFGMPERSMEVCQELQQQP
ncbi:uncharacterized protein LOC115483319 [Drosophila hydei]|uniref:Uncharacterized protein LOC115483319 n=1 Tax=Drosophila hydei TaxID=7224 RepID=A0A6J2SWK4_DROHY|nr:uncharacterized protein LOC115483319 [Drosophila hydei]